MERDRRNRRTGVPRYPISLCDMLIDKVNNNRKLFSGDALGSGLKITTLKPGTGTFTSLKLLPTFFRIPGVGLPNEKVVDACRLA